MSHAIIRGNPNKSQLYLDTVLDGILRNGPNQRRERKDVNLGEILFYSLKENLSGVFMMDGSTGKVTRNEDLLRFSVSLSRAMKNNGLEGKIVMFIVRNHEQMAALYYAVLFAGVVPLPIDPNSTSAEIQYFINLVTPLYVFCDEDRYSDIVEITKSTPGSPKVISADKNKLIQFAEGQSDDFSTYEIRRISTASMVMLLPTSGSTGLSKAAILSDEGLVAQIPSLWVHHTNFPKPTERIMLLSTAQWMTHTLVMTTAPVYNIQLLMSPEKPTVEHILYLLEKYQPTWTLLSPGSATDLAVTGSKEKFQSLDSLVVTGAKPTMHTINVLMDKLPKKTTFGIGFGMTETHGFSMIPEANVDIHSNGKVFNILDYKIVDDKGKRLGPNEKGELCFKSDACVFKGYYKNENAYKECITPDGWLKSGDVFYENDNGNLYYVEKIKFSFKYRNYHISPEEIENVILNSIPGIIECVVCSAKNGPAAGVVLKSGYDQEITKQTILEAVESSLSDHKKLRGGVAFIDAVPRTHTGKIDRKTCNALIEKKI